MVNNAIVRAMDAYNMLHSRTSDVNGEAREKVTSYICALVEFGETDGNRLMAMGLQYLTDLDETNGRPNGPRRLH